MEATGMKETKEQRGTRRKQLETEVVLHSASLGTVRAKTRDISYGGMRLVVKPLVLNPNTRVRVTLIVRQAAEVAHRTIDALVIYINQQGCGLRFDSLDRNTFKFLQTMMRLEPQAVVG